MDFLNSVVAFFGNILEPVSFVKHPAFWLAVIFALAVIYSIYAKIRDGKAAKKTPEAAKNTSESPKATVAAPDGVSNGELDLIETDEKTAAVIMAIVSNKSGIPLNRLSFKSIRLMEDK